MIFVFPVQGLSRTQWTTAWYHPKNSNEFFGARRRGDEINNKNRGKTRDIIYAK